MSRQLAGWLGYLVFVVYGSLVPLDYHALPSDLAWRQFAQIPFLSLGAEQRADWIANGVLYAPLALLLAHLLGPRLGWMSAAWIAWLGCAALAVGIEFVQQFFPPRTVSQNDILAEWIGSAVGVLLAPRIDGWARGLGQAWSSRGSRLPLFLLQGYAVAYLLLNFFPYDLVLSASELRVKANSTLWAWWTAPSERGTALVFVQLVAEALLCLPLGALLALGRKRRLQAVTAAQAGLMLGLLLEAGQFFIVSGVSQGASVLARGAGFAAGAWLAPRIIGMAAARARSRVRQLASLLLLLWLPPLLLANGWFRVAWQGPDAAAASWAELRLLPFYYHYYTTEAIALFSLGAVALMYLPLSLLAWAWDWRLRSHVAVAAALVTAVEASKLFLQGMRPDPTNVLIAVASSTLVLWLLRRWGRPTTASASLPMAATTPRAGGSAIAAGLFLAAGLALAAVHPVARMPLGLLLIAAAAVVWRRPAAALFLIAAGLPMLDLAPWSGRIFVDEWDMLVIVCLGVAWARTVTPSGSAKLAGRIAFVLVGTSLAIAALRGLWPLQSADLAALNHPAGPWAAARIAKGAVWAALLLAVWGRLESEGERRARLLTAGMVVGLAATVAFIVWERWAFGALDDLGRELRVTGPFSQMSKGGAYVECYLVVATAFLLGPLLGRVLHRAWRTAGLVLLAATVLALMLTFSRNGYAALLVVVCVLGLAMWREGSPVARRWGWPAIGLAMLVAIPVAVSPYASSRLVASGKDLALRHAHWQDAMSLRSPGWPAALFGEGLGRFPERHFWRSREAQRAATYRVMREDDMRFLRLGVGATIYIEQVITRPGAPGASLHARVRSSSPRPALQIAICEKWTLTSRECASVVLRPEPAAAAGNWLAVSESVNMPPRASGLPLKFSLMTPSAGEAIDITDLRLLDGDGNPLLANGDFARGMDRWFFATDVDPPWHIHNLPLAIWFDQGWFGVLSWSVLVAWALTAAVRTAMPAGPGAWVPLAAVLGFLASGLLNTLIDEPRFLMLLLWLLGLAGRGAFARRAAGP